MSTEEKLVIHGGKPLEGMVEVRGSKNAASKMMIASLLTDQPCVLTNVPLSSEIDITRELCEQVGSDVSIGADHVCRIQTPAIKTSVVSELTRKNRIPILALGSLLHRKGSAEVPFPAGDPIGHRPINLHLEALNKMGVRIERRGHSYYAEADDIHGAQIALSFPSVGATENIILTAALARGETRISNAAIEPEIMNMIEMLDTMGARIAVDADAREIRIQGVDKLNGTVARVIPDRNEIVSFAAAALATGGSIFIPDINPSHLRSFLAALEEIGAIADLQPNGICFSGVVFNGLRVQTSPHPGFMTDWQQPFGVLLTQAEGESVIHEIVYEDRFGYAKELSRMGADILVSDECLGFDPCRFAGQTFNHSMRIRGPRKLQGRDIMVHDIRAGMAHIVAALVAQGESVIAGIHHIDRGYEKLDERLRMLGADIKRI